MELERGSVLVSWAESRVLNLGVLQAVKLEQTSSGDVTPVLLSLSGKCEHSICCP